MFNLIVSGGDWQPHSDTFPVERVFEYTDDHLVAQFKPNGVLDINAVRALPTLFMEEGSGEEIARFGRLTDVRRQGTSYIINYAYDPALPTVTNRRIAEIAADLGIADWEFSRTHWAIKSANIFEAFYRLKSLIQNYRA